MQYKIGHSQKQRRFEIDCNGHTAFLEYMIAEGVMDILHTNVPAELEGKGMASALVKQALDYARENHLSVVPSCSFAETYMIRHKEYEDLLLA